MKTHPAKLQAITAVVSQTKKLSQIHMIRLFVLSFLFCSFCQHSSAQCVAPSMSFHSPVLISGVDNQVGAVYLFREVMPGVDADITVTDLVGGAVLYNIDDSAGIGYYDAFQPYVVAPANSTSYLDWNITFKVAGTATDTLIPCFAITGVDVDGNGSSLQEFVEAATPGSYALDPFTILTFSFDGVRSKAVSQVANIPLIDTAHREAMFQMNFTNISTLQYRNGAISTYGSDMVRQTCIYFKSFFDNYTALLPVKLISFTAQSKSNTTLLNWSATNENDLQYYVVQKTTNGTLWKDVKKVMPGIAITDNYFITDEDGNTAVTYYRLKQVQRTGQPVYSKMVKVNPAVASGGNITNNTVVKDAVHLQITAAGTDIYRAEVYTMNGNKIKQQQLNVYAGFNTATIELPAGTRNGMYVLSIKNGSGQQIHQSKLMVN